MIKRTWLILALAVITVMSLVTYAGVTQSFFSDNENSSDDRLGIRWGHNTISDGFENTGSPAWDDNWDENGTTTWVQDSVSPHSGNYSAKISDFDSPGYLTSDDLNTSTASNVTVVFWFKLNNLEAGDCVLQLYNGITYNNWYDLINYPTYVENTWCKFTEVITDPQYLLAGLRLRFDSSSLGDDTEQVNIDDIYMDYVTPAAPTNLIATPGDEQIILDWDDNSEGDLIGYNVYRSTTNGSGYAKINIGPVATSNFTDYPLWGGGTYYYVVTSFDLANMESSYTSEVTATAIDVAPASPTGLAATPGDRQVSLDWNDNIEGDLDGYNIYRSTINGSGYTQINGSLVASNNYLDTTTHGGYTYYYVVTAVDLGSNESGYSNEDSGTPSRPTSISDGFEGSPWDFNWDENGTTDWTQDSSTVYSGTYATQHASGDTYLVSDDIDMSSAGGIDISFWFQIKDLSKGPLYVQLYNGATYVEVYNLLDYPGLTKNTWYQYSVTITDSQFFRSDFRIRFDGSSQTTDTFIDDVIVVRDTTPPAAPTGLVVTAGDQQVSLDWDDNGESDLNGYNVYRGLSSGNYTQIASLVAGSNYTDNGLTGGVTYYYVVTAEDKAANESSYSNEDSATPTDSLPAAPTGLVATATLGSLQVTLDWDDNGESDLNGYNVYRGLSSGNYTQIASLVTSSSYTDNAVTELVTYYYVVTAVDNGSNESGYSDEDSAMPDLAPTAPTGLVVTAGEKQVSLDWDDNGESDLNGYNVYRGLSSGNYTQIASLISSSNYTDNGLTGGVTYYYVVTAEDNGANESDYSNEDSAMPTDLPPATPTGLAATPGDGQVSLDWNDNGEGDLDGYNIYRSLTSGDNYTQINGLPVTTSNYTDTGLTNDTTYYYVVTAVDVGSNESGYSSEVSAMPTDLPPAAPTGLAATPGDGQVSLDWNNNGESDLDGYNIYRSLTSGDNYTQVNGLPVTTSNYTDTGLTNDTTYYYVVTAVDLGSNESSYSSEVSAMPADPPPAAPTGLVVTAGDKQASLDWDDNGESDLNGYNVYRGLSSGNYTQIASLVSSSNYTDNGLNGGVTYYYVVTAEDLGSNESGYSNEDSATPNGVTVINDGFEGTLWDLNWDDNGTTDWTQNSGTVYSGVYAARHASGDTYLVSDDIDMSSASSIEISFWFQIKSLSKGPLYVQLYNGATYVEVYNLLDYPGLTKNTWYQYSVVITDSQYFRSDFRIRFDGSSQTTDTFIDDVLIIYN
ncbi:MAG: hypothetical protein JSU79_09855 [Dehalococcoidales bacterium]|nr:MAG: hypothetical protein JSU79_09855 [Dehalococcoidales bacterium]